MALASYQVLTSLQWKWLFSESEQIRNRSNTFSDKTVVISLAAKYLHFHFNRRVCFVSVKFPLSCIPFVYIIICIFFFYLRVFKLLFPFEIMATLSNTVNRKIFQMTVFCCKLYILF